MKKQQLWLTKALLLHNNLLQTTGFKKSHAEKNHCTFLAQDKPLTSSDHDHSSTWLPLPANLAAYN